MSGLSRRAFLGGASTALLAAAGCSFFADSQGSAAPATSTPPVPPRPTEPSSQPAFRLIGDGSTADTGDQPHQPVPDRLEPGQIPPQFVVFSWDGAANLETGLFPRGPCKVVKQAADLLECWRREAAIRCRLRAVASRAGPPSRSDLGSSQVLSMQVKGRTAAQEARPRLLAAITAGQAGQS